MNKKVIILIFFLVCILSISFIYADEESPVDSDPVEIDYSGEDPTLWDSIERYNNGELTYEVKDLQTEVLRISPSDTSGFHAVILTVLGDYNPIVKDYTYQSQQGYTQHSINIEPDYSWIATAAIFLVIVYCTFRFLGGIFSHE